MSCVIQASGGGGAPSGAAGGDLSGTYPNPTVAYVNGLIAGTAANADVGDFATAAQGAKADSALQPAGDSSALTGVSSAVAAAIAAAIAAAAPSYATAAQGAKADSALQPNGISGSGAAGTVVNGQITAIAA